jgi:L-asparaginase II
MVDATAPRFESAASSKSISSKSIDATAASVWGRAGGGELSRLTVIETRGDAVEAIHEVAAALCDDAGTLLRAFGPFEPVTTWRSAAKPFQLAASLDALGAVAGPLAGAAASRAGALAVATPDRITFTDADLALGAASHSGQPGHVDGVNALLTCFGLLETCLRCGAHSPVHVASADALVRTSALPSPIHNNCSGKHTFMLAAATALGDDPDRYLDPESRVQRAIRARIGSLTGADVRTVTDGCGAPCFVLSLSAMARAYARLAAATADATPEGDFDSSEARPRPTSLLGAIGRAMNREAWWMSGDGRLDLALVQAASEPVISKVGAAGVLCVALPGRRLGLALKVLSGSDAARPVAARFLLDVVAPGLLRPSCLEEDHVVRNVAGRVVGQRRVV